MKKIALLLIAHGSKNKKWAEPFEDLKREFKDKSIFIVYLTKWNEGINKLSLKKSFFKSDELLILPFLMSYGNHSKKDIVYISKKIKNRFPKLKVKVLKPIGLHRKVKAMFREVTMSYLNEA